MACIVYMFLVFVTLLCVLYFYIMYPVYELEINLLNNDNLLITSLTQVANCVYIYRECSHF